MSLLPLENPLTRLNLFPNTMNYRGGWSATVQYYANDVVISVADSKTYILTGKIAILGGGDPSTNADWETIASTGTGVQSVTADALTGVENIGTAQNVVLVNTGVISVTTNTLDGIENIGTAQNQQLVNTGVLSVTTVPSSGISISGPANKPILANDGVITVTTLPASGISITGPPTNPVLANDGVISVVPSTGISITGPASAPTIENTGIITITAGTGISVSAGQNPSIGNTGVISCSEAVPPANGGLQITGTVTAPVFAWGPLASGTVQILNPAVTATVNVPYPLTATSVIMLTFYNDNVIPPASPYNANPVGGQTVWWNLTATPTQFEIQLGNTPAPVDAYISVKWALLAVSL